jgi:hypothetical protein
MDWAAYYDLAPWGGERDDIRMEVFRQRMVVAIVGKKPGSEVPDALYPHFGEKLDPATALAEMRKADEMLVWDEAKKTYVWKE